MESIGSSQYVPQVLGLATGAFSAIARWSSEILGGQKKFRWTHLPLVMFVGGFLGYMGAELSHVMQIPQWSNIFAGASGAMGSYGFDFYIRKLEKMSNNERQNGV